ncbi:6-hydroxy-d-nicotine oxidase [Grosmannia clavigera kw1407]|uniref:6-hydroxy-d-nicotine oxidase n=1 Tax=Grosmannia clavigera (strain kw1407 / UAMH 11150) TaxID=655863 RepID=F0XDT3_GROCL|nr:6-hydroxy-d-nicotine oxidase [Grosmannia clavigera kw1407]EFX04755.1 6-hydroxy-d-nicotine oxidase [Grosmannia clavigera kw1407]
MPFDMATLDALKGALRQHSTATSSQKQPLSNAEYSAGFDILAQGTGWMVYQDFIIPQLSQLLASLVSSRSHISALEIGPGPKSVLGYLPDHLKRKVGRYVAFEPNGQFATRLKEWLGSSGEAAPFPCLEDPADIHPIPFALDSGAGDGKENFDIVLFCHSMYGMTPKRKFIERALGMLTKQPEHGFVVVFHRDGTLRLDGLVCHRTASFPTGVVSVSDKDEVLDNFSSFIAGHSMQDANEDKVIRTAWRKMCRTLGRHEDSQPDHLLFSAPDLMVAFNQGATTLPELMESVPSWEQGARAVKNREARLHHPAAIMRPTEVRHVQQCVRWALKHEVGLVVISGGHSGHCLWPNVVSVDMGAFDQVHVISSSEEDGAASGLRSGSLVISGAGCKTGDIIREAMAAGLTVSLGSRPSVGAGLLLQGGIGHLARQHGLSCDAIVGAVVVSVATGKTLCVGCVPRQHQPAGAVRPENEEALLWAIRGAGTNFGIVVSLTLQAYAAPSYLVRNWVLPLSGSLEAQRGLGDFDRLVARSLPRNCSSDAYLYWDADQLHIGVTVIEASVHRSSPEPPATLSMAVSIDEVLGPENSFQIVDGLELFETEMYMSGMHGGHGGKTSAFKRCLFLGDIGDVNIAKILTAAIETRPSALCYLHLLHGGEAVNDVAAEATAFGCRDWHFACVITAVWPRDQDGTEAARAAVRWVYRVAMDLLPWSSGAYGADLGPDPRDIALAAVAFGPNRPRLIRLKQDFDPYNVLAYASPLLRPSRQPKLIVLVTGEFGVGKDYCAGIWASMFSKQAPQKLEALVVSISDVTKREYAAATGADFDRLLGDRAYKEQHRPALTKYFQEQVRQRPRLPEEHFLSVVQGAIDVDVLLVTGMRDDAPVAFLSHLVPYSRLIEVRVEAAKAVRQARRGCDANDEKDNGKDSSSSRNNHAPSLVFDNDTAGSEAARRFAEHRLLPFFHADLQRLADMVRPVPDFPRPGINFRHVLDIAQQPGGLALCTSLLRTLFAGDWTTVGALACCEAGGFVYASALAARVDIELPLVLIRKAGKLPPPTVTVAKAPSHISASTPNSISDEERIEMGRHVVTPDAKVLVVDDVLATGQTLCAVLRLLREAGIPGENISAVAVAEFPVHRGRELLHRHGFGRVRVQSLLVFPGV